MSDKFLDAKFKKNCESRKEEFNSCQNLGERKYLDYLLAGETIHVKTKSRLVVSRNSDADVSLILLYL